MIIVWTRDDGYVGSSKTERPQAWWDRHRERFTVAGSFVDADWSYARGLITDLRLSTPCPFCKQFHWADNCPDDVDEIVREARKVLRQEGLTPDTDKIG